MLGQKNLLVALILSLLIIIDLHGQNEKVNFTNGAKIETQSFAEENKAMLFELKAQYPRIAGFDGRAADDFNRKVKSLVLGKLNEFRRDMLGQTSQDLKFARERGVSNYSEVNYTIELANNGIVSVWFGNSTYSGGAHPNSESFTFNFDLQKGTEIKLRDLFQQNSGYLKRISDYAISDLKRQQSDFSDNDWISRGAGPDSKNFRSWNVTDKGLKFNFDPYQVAAYAAGPQTVLISYGALKDILKAVNFEPIQSASYIDGNPPNWCRNGHFPRESVEFRLAAVIGKRNSRAYFYGDNGVCPEGKNCRKKSYVKPGDLVIISRTYGNKVCSWYQPKRGNETVGWININQLKISEPNKNLRIEQWVGSWKSNGNSLSLKRNVKAGYLKVTGNAFWKGVGDNIHIGEVDESGKPSGNELNLGGQEKYDCRVRIQLVSNFLIVSDNMMCGGANVTFSGVYLKK